MRCVLFGKNCLHAGDKRRNIVWYKLLIGNGSIRFTALKRSTGIIIKVFNINV